MSVQGGEQRISHYRVVGELGRDRLGFALRAMDESLDRPVALKVVRAVDVYPAGAVQEARERFRRNAQRAARLVHPNLVTLYGFEQIGDADVLAMELVDGETLKGRLARGDRWRALDAAALMARIADGVAAAHARQLVHGHLSLQNVKLRPDGRLKVLDFGIPKASVDELAHAATTGGGEANPWPEATFQDDVAALGRITCYLITGAFRRAGDAAAVDSESAVIADPVFPDPARVLVNFGVLAPILGRALGLEGAPFADAGAFRDALVDVVESGGRRPAEHMVEAGIAQVGTVSPLLRHGGRVNPLVEAEGALGALDKFAGEAKSPALVLPLDLAANAHVPSTGSYVVMDEPTRIERMRHAVEKTADRFARVRRGRVVAAAAALVVLTTAALVARRITSGDASAAMIVEDVPPGALASVTPPTPVALPPLPAVDSVADTTAVAADSSVAVRTAVLQATPRGTAIAVVGSDTGRWMDRADLSVAEGDSMVLRLVRSGYVPRTVVFRGEPLTAALTPDSVTVRIETNIEAQIFLIPAGAGEPRLLGTTALTTRLPTGSHRFAFLAENQDDWSVTRRFDTPGQTYTVRKMDYATRGGFVATVAGGWAWVSVDGGDEHETPFRFDDLPTGRHIVRLRRDGFSAVVDTVVVRGGQVLTRQYTLSRSP